MRGWRAKTAVLICSALLLLALRKEITCSLRLERANHLSNSWNVHSNSYVRYEVLATVKMRMSAAWRRGLCVPRKCNYLLASPHGLVSTEDKLRHTRRHENIKYHITFRPGGFEVLTVESMKMAAFLVVTPWSLVENYRLLRSTCCPHPQGYRASPCIEHLRLAHDTWYNTSWSIVPEKLIVTQVVTKFPAFILNESLLNLHIFRCSD
jgi:hypothetical protein